MTKFEDLTKEVQEQIKSDLGMYDQTHVIFENGKYNVSSSICISSHYPKDHKFIGTYYAKDIFTEEEHIIAEIMSFGYSPTYNITFYPNKQAWNDKAKKYEHVRDAFLKKEIAHYINLFGHEPSQEWINRI